MKPYFKSLTKLTLLGAVVFTAHRRQWLTDISDKVTAHFASQMTEQIQQKLNLPLTSEQRQQWLQKWQTALLGEDPKLTTKREMFNQALNTLVKAKQVVFIGYLGQAPRDCWYGPLYRLQGTLTFVVFDPDKGAKCFQLADVSGLEIGLDSAPCITLADWRLTDEPA
ncbi:MAG: hypothetical protein AAF629_00255 [Chloroflexota bacterium]